MKFDLDMPAWKWPFYVMRHPFGGFEDVRWKKAYHGRVSLIIVLFFFIATVCEQQLTGFLFKTSFEKVFNIVPLFSISVILFFVWVVGNWSLCTLFDGEGNMKQIMCVSAYALVPYIISSFITTIISNMLVRSESAFIFFISYLGLAWSAILMISAIKAVHQYSMPKTIIAMAFTVVAMAVIIILAVLLISLFQQVFIFGYSVYTELLYRFSI